MIGFPQPRYVPCPECGASVARPELDGHACDAERRLDYQMSQLRAGIEAFDGQLEAYLGSPEGRFHVWRAERDRPAS